MVRRIAVKWFFDGYSDGGTENPSGGEQWA
jgi:hypothetical protein